MRLPAGLHAILVRPELSSPTVLLRTTVLMRPQALRIGSQKHFVLYVFVPFLSFRSPPGRMARQEAVSRFAVKLTFDFSSAFCGRVLPIPWLHTRSWPLVGHGIAGWLMWKHWCCLQNIRLISAPLVSQLDLSGPDWLLQLQIISAYFIPNKISNGHNVLFSENNTP